MTAPADTITDATLRDAARELASSLLALTALRPQVNESVEDLCPTCGARLPRVPLVIGRGRDAG